MPDRGPITLGHDNLTDAYVGILLHLENAIHEIAYANKEISDGQIELALERLIRHFQTEAGGREPRPTRLGAGSQQVFDGTMIAAELLLGHAEASVAETREPLAIGNESISHGELIACLKRLRKSVRFWSRQGGRRGYVSYIHNFLSGESDL
mgnify:CR=1 FL=1